MGAKDGQLLEVRMPLSENNATMAMAMQKTGREVIYGWGGKWHMSPTFPRWKSTILALMLAIPPKGCASFFQIWDGGLDQRNWHNPINSL